MDLVIEVIHVLNFLSRLPTGPTPPLRTIKADPLIPLGSFVVLEIRWLTARAPLYLLAT